MSTASDLYRIYAVYYSTLMSAALHIALFTIHFQSTHVHDVTDCADAERQPVIVLQSCTTARAPYVE